MISELPCSLIVNGVEYPINYDYRDAFDAFEACNAKDLSPSNKQLAVLEIIYGDNIPDDIDEAMRQAVWFLDGGDVIQSETSRRTMDYEQDAPMLFSAVNKVAGYEIRSTDRVTHWWTFLGYCAEIDPDSPIAYVVHIRSKIAKGKKLEKHEQEFYRENKRLVDFSDRDIEYDEMIRALQG